MSDDKTKSYRDSLNLPNTSFPMKADLVQREPQIRKKWQKDNLYAKIREARKGSPLYILHDGPPYANGDIHMGHVINKVLKDFVIKYKTMTGFDAPYVPGWDCHGLPIEAKVVTELAEKARMMSKLEIRQDCKKYASKYVKLQSKQFQELGVLGDFDNPYLTLKPTYEAAILEVFATLVEKGLVYKQLKPIHWSIGCETALAEAELEYKDIASPSIFVNFPTTKETAAKLTQLGLIDPSDADANICFMIWTTTPWTLAANLAVAANPKLEYTSITYNLQDKKFVSILATERVNAVVAAGELQEGQYKVCSKNVKGSRLEGLRYSHPFVEKNPTDKDAYMLILADYVTIEDGSGLVHIAPGHGVEDYIAGQNYGLAIYSPVLNDGSYDNTVPDWLKGKNVLKVDRLVNDRLKQQDLLFAQKQLTHSYPHCWRSKTPVVFRATEQWFIGVDKDLISIGKSLRNLALERIKKVNWIPSWGQKRIEGMLESRPDWCISRQRSWGLPIPVFINSEGNALLTKDSVLAVARYIVQKGSDSWFNDSPKDILGSDFKLPAGFSFDDLKKEENIFDVWFESGCSWYAVAKKTGWPVPVDLYLEGSDQHRGWFQLSLLPALGAIEQEPFKNVLTHGFTVDEKGMKQSKSLGNYVSAQEEITKYGSDILRLWVSSVNYQEDMRCNDELIGRTQDAYRKIRNTMRYLFGNVDDFDPAKNSVTYDKMFPIDKWAYQQLSKLIQEVHDSYESFAFHRVFSLIYNFCSVEMSSIYMDVLKDRLYCDAADSISRRSCQTVLYKTLDALIRMLAPVLAHTAEEAWAVLKFKSQNVDSVHLAAMLSADSSVDWKTEESKWQKILALREQVLVALEALRKDQKIGSAQEASVTINCSDKETTDALESFGLDNFASLCIVCHIELIKNATETKVEAQNSNNHKCQRCWNYWPTVGSDSNYPDLCRRCLAVVTAGSQQKA